LPVTSYQLSVISYQLLIASHSTLETFMRIWLIGADVAGSTALRQLRKNPAAEVIVSDSTAMPRAVADKVIEHVDYVESVTAMNVNSLARRVRPDLILVDGGALQRALGKMAGGVTFAESLQAEMAAASDYPVLVL
jgi:hypothetical protein